MKNILAWLGKNWSYLTNVVLFIALGVVSFLYYQEYQKHQNVSQAQNAAITDLQQQEAALAAEKGVNSDLASYINNANKIINDLRSNLASTEEKLRNLTAAHNVLTREKERLDEDHTSLQASFRSQREGFDSLSALNNLNIRNYNALAKENQELVKDISKLTDNFNELGQKNQTLAAETAQVSKANSELTGKLSELTSRTSQLAGELTNAQRTIQNLNSQVARLTAENERLKATPAPASGEGGGGGGGRP